MAKLFYRAVVFCSNPLTGYYRFEDKFQIYPFASEYAPAGDKVRAYPIAIEYCVDSEVEMHVPELLSEVKEIVTQTTQSANYQKQLLSLLSTITNYRFYYPTPQLQWFVELPNGELTEELNKQKSKQGISFYWYPEMYEENSITSFSEPPFPKVELAKHPEYFQHVDVDGVEAVRFSEHITVAIHNYFALTGEMKAAVDSAITLICNGIDLRTSMKSISFVSFVSGIETMASFEFKDEEVKKCVTCGTQAHRVMGKFKDYFLKYVSSNPANKKEIDRIYTLRSKIAHAGALLLSDHLIDWSDEKKQNQQWQTHVQVMQLSRVALTNWILTRG